MEGEQEAFFMCPYCGSSISMLFETFHGGQDYIEDCEVCCRPIEVSYQISAGEMENVQVRRLDE